MVVTQASLPGIQPPSLSEEGSPAAFPLQPHVPAVQQAGEGLDEHTECSQLLLSACWEERGAGISLLSLLIKEQVSSACLHTVV